jgi:HK97 gp10 family phage protein
MAKLIITGDRELNRMLRRLALKDGKKVVRAAARKAIKPVQLSAKQLAPKDSGQLRRAVKVRALPRSRRRVGVRVTIGERFFTGDQFYGSFQEWGWKTGKRGSANRRQIPGKHFLREAADSNRAKVIAIYRREIRKGIIAAAKAKA